MQLGKGGRFRGRSFATAPSPDPELELGEVRFTVTDHADTDSYEIRVREEGSSTVIASEDIGKPTPSGNNTITVDITDFLGTVYGSFGAGDYTVSVAAINGEGENDSALATAFSLPLS
jgi:hypothetical protein